MRKSTHPRVRPSYYHTLLARTLISILFISLSLSSFVSVSSLPNLPVLPYTKPFSASVGSLIRVRVPAYVDVTQTARGNLFVLSGLSLSLPLVF